MRLNSLSFPDSVQIVIQKLLELSNDIVQQEKELQKDHDEWDQGQQPIASGKIVLDVGGEKFATTHVVLTGQPGFFRVLFGGRISVQKDADGCYFIDRDPCVFRHVVNYLRGQPSLPTQKKELELLKEECEFYELQGLIQHLNSYNEKSTDNNNNNTIPQNQQNDIWKSIKELEKIYHSHNSRLKEAKNNLNSQKEDFQRLKTKIESCCSAEKIKLDIGGKIFATSLKTLTGTEGFFKAMFGGKFALKPEEDGSFFIDRDYFVFHHILRYLRTSRVPTDLTEDEIQGLLTEADYYSLPELINSLQKNIVDLTTVEFDPHNKSDKIELINNNKTIRKTTEYIHGKIFAKRPICDGMKWSVRIDDCGTSYYIAVGISKKNTAFDEPLPNTQTSSKDSEAIAWPNGYSQLFGLTSKSTDVSYGVGDIVGFSYEEGVLSVLCNSKIVATVEVPKGEFYPAFTLFSTKCQITLCQIV